MMYLFVRQGWWKLRELLLILIPLVEVVVGQVEIVSLIGQKFKKFAEELFVDDNVYVVAVIDIRVGTQYHNDIFVDMPSLENVHEPNDLLQKEDSLPYESLGLFKDSLISNLKSATNAIKF